MSARCDVLKLALELHEITCHEPAPAGNAGTNRGHPGSWHVVS